MKRLLAITTALILSTSLAQIQTEMDAVEAIFADTQTVELPCPPSDISITRCGMLGVEPGVAAAMVSRYADSEGWVPRQEMWEAGGGGLSRTYLYHDDYGSLWLAVFGIVGESLVVGFSPTR